MKKIFIHGTGHTVASWDQTIACMKQNQEILCPDLSSILDGKEATYANLYTSFAEYCNGVNGQMALCGISLGGVLALDYALNFPEKVQSLVLIGTPHKVPKIMLGIQNIIFRCLPGKLFEGNAFDKKATLLLSNSMKNLDFSDRAQEVKCPVLVICGEKDSANMKSAHYFHEYMEQAELVIVENAGHVVNEEAPERLAELLDKFYGSNNS